MWQRDSDDDNLHRLFDQTAPLDPGAEAWDRVLRGVRAGLDANNRADTPRRRLLLPALAFAASAAAALVAATALMDALPGPMLPAPPGPIAGPPVGEDVEPYPVLESHEVTVNSIEGDDAFAVVVGGPRIDGPLVLVAHGDIQIDERRPHDDGMVVDVDRAGASPMLTPPPGWGKD